MATATKTKPAAPPPWQAQIINELEQLTADELGANSHAIVWIRDNGNAQLLHLAEGAAAATVTAEDDASKVHGGEVTTVPLTELQEWIEHHGHEMLPVKGSDLGLGDHDYGNQTDEIPEDDAADGLPIAGTASGPDAETGQLFDVPRPKVTVDDSDPTVIKLAFSGGIELDRSIPADVQFYNRLTAGKTVSLELDAHVAGAKTIHRRDSNGDVDAIVQTKSLTIHSIEIA